MRSGRHALLINGLQVRFLPGSPCVCDLFEKIPISAAPKGMATEASVESRVPKMAGESCDGAGSSETLWERCFRWSEESSLCGVTA
jgi:hypothetical protein